MMNLTAEGLVIRKTDVGEKDRILSILAMGLGRISASARGARAIRSRVLASSQIFSYSRFSLYKGRELYIVDSAEPLESFFALQNDIEKLSLGNYFLELLGWVTDENVPEDGILRLALNTLYLLAYRDRPLPLVKAAFELRLLSLAGYQPELAACGICGEAQPADARFDLLEGTLVCGTCKGSCAPVSPGVLAAMRHIVYSEPQRIFSFSLGGEALISLSDIAERYVFTHIHEGFPTLEFYKSLIIK